MTSNNTASSLVFGLPPSVSSNTNSAGSTEIRRSDRDRKPTRYREEKLTKALYNETSESLRIRKSPQSNRKKTVSFAGSKENNSPNIDRTKSTLEREFRQHRTQSELMNENMVELEKINEKMNTCMRAQRTEIKKYENKIKKRENEINKYENEIIKRDNEIKFLKKQVKFYRGNVQIVCRVRPMKSSENGSSCIIFPEENKLRVTVMRSNLPNQGYTATDHVFKVDAVEKETSSQQDVFLHVMDVLENFVKGINITIAVHGQSGSGKYYTLFGDDSKISSTHAVLITRSINYLFGEQEKLKTQGWEIAIKMKQFDVYEDQLIDLNSDSCKSKREKLCNEENMTAVNLYSKEQACDIIKSGKGRATSNTKQNVSLPRTHFVAKLLLTGYNDSTKKSFKASVTFLDLANSEKQNIAERKFNEAKFINLSLSHFSNVIRALKNKSERIPHRESLLTNVLRGGLSCHSKVILILTVSQNEHHAQESLSTIRFASVANPHAVGDAPKTN